MTAKYARSPFSPLRNSFSFVSRSQIEQIKILREHRIGYVLLIIFRIGFCGAQWKKNIQKLLEKMKSHLTLHETNRRRRRRRHLFFIHQILSANKMILFMFGVGERCIYTYNIEFHFCLCALLMFFALFVFFFLFSASIWRAM